MWPRRSNTGLILRDATASLLRMRTKASVRPRSLAPELRRPLLEERRHALAEIFGRARALLALRLGVELLLVRVVLAVPVQAADQRQRNGRPVGKLVRQLLRLGRKLSVVEDAGDEAPLQRLLGRQPLAEHRQLDRARL